MRSSWHCPFNPLVGGIWHFQGSQSQVPNPWASSQCQIPATWLTYFCEGQVLAIEYLTLEQHLHCTVSNFFPGEGLLSQFPMGLSVYPFTMGLNLCWSSSLFLHLWLLSFKILPYMYILHVSSGPELHMDFTFAWWSDMSHTCTILYALSYPTYW